MEEVSAAIFQAHQEGKTLPVDKVTQLGVALDSPIDFYLEPEFVASVQASMVIPQQNPQGAPASSSASMGTETDLLTPLQKSAYAG